ncbi:type II toxin-antitoxin system RelE/ParE family toxin [Mordavella massiliensis]|uniref:type II toxin-antitoxin system RelE/ParE family toxin n=1 Tax=Mordavella massiliensis TaxID=1871024 RepID=UPI0037096E4C
MDYNVVVTKSAEEDLDRFIQYLLFEKGNEQAAKNVLDDFERTIRTLEQVAGSLKYCENPRLNAHVR